MCTKRLVPESHSTSVHDSKNICKQLLVRKLTLVQRGQGETNERGRPLQIGLRNFDKQGNCLVPLFTRLLLSGQKTRRSSYTPANLKSSYRDLTWVPSVFSPDGLNNMLLSQGCILHNGSHYGNGGKNAHSQGRAGEEEPLIAQESADGHVLSAVSSHNNMDTYQ